MWRKIRQQLESNLKPNWIFYIYIYIWFLPVDGGNLSL